MDAWGITLLAMFVLLAVSLAAMTWMVLREQRIRERAGLREWTTGLALQTLAWPLFAVPTHVLGGAVQAIACAMLVAGYAAMLRALLRSLPATRARTPLSWAVLYLPALVLLLVLLLPAQAPQARIAMFWSAALLTVLLAARAPLRRRGRRPAPERALVVLFAVAALVCIYRLAEQAWNPQAGPAFDAGMTPGQQLALAYFLVAPVFATFAFLLLQLERQQRWLEDLAAEDALTGIHNRRAFVELARKRLARARGDGLAALLMIDVDGFKAVNDVHGHAAGDRVLANIAARLRAAARDGDVVGRFGGDEFCMLLTGAGIDDATERAERVRAQIAASPPTLDGATTAVTLSIGIAHVREGREADLDALLATADRRLYLAKRAGRNRVIDRDVEVALPAPA
ncbi:GGDEF domain-containing protein [Luteimonas sp. 3794]|uniref:GGDEF domain-containing protein n=1 Tax=Luteimonas sp. 3794 TaxID=2817730 RepID=UPI0028661CF9|nr:GGDEF domain-containing protein [Luteimonas sp. 3794]MDR6990339.1 diguanylate cyclase (GGDEF)-like protein [Luteimonas sp. 3794]